MNMQTNTSTNKLLEVRPRREGAGGPPRLLLRDDAEAHRGGGFRVEGPRKGGGYGRKPSSSSNLSIRALRALSSC